MEDPREASFWAWLSLWLCSGGTTTNKRIWNIMHVTMCSRYPNITDVLHQAEDVSTIFGWLTTGKREGRSGQTGDKVVTGTRKQGFSDSGWNVKHVCALLFDIGHQRTRTVLAVELSDLYCRWLGQGLQGTPQRARLATQRVVKARRRF
jgi:hypothetical protein